jgi:hypothetical protein
LAQGIGFTFPNVVINDGVPVRVCVGDHRTVFTGYTLGVDFRAVGCKGVGRQSQKNNGTEFRVIPDANHA